MDTTFGAARENTSNETKQFLSSGVVAKKQVLKSKFKKVKEIRIIVPNYILQTLYFVVSTIQGSIML